MDIPIRAEIVCRDGVCGRSTGVMFNAAKEVTHLLVREYGWNGAERMVPVKQIITSTPEAIHLNCTRLEVMACEPFSEEEFVHVEVNTRVGGNHHSPQEH